MAASGSLPVYKRHQCRLLIFFFSIVDLSTTQSYPRSEYWSYLSILRSLLAEYRHLHCIVPSSSPTNNRSCVQHHTPATGLTFNINASKHFNAKYQKQKCPLAQLLTAPTARQTRVPTHPALPHLQPVCCLINIYNATTRDQSNCLTASSTSLYANSGHSSSRTKRYGNKPPVVINGGGQINDPNTSTSAPNSGYYN